MIFSFLYYCIQAHNIRNYIIQTQKTVTKIGPHIGHLRDT